MFVDTIVTEMPNRINGQRLSPDALLAMVKQSEERAKLRLYIGAAAGVGKTYQMLEDAHALFKQSVDVVGAVETHGRAETAAMIGDLEIVPQRKIEYNEATFEEMVFGSDYPPQTRRRRR